jgi:hypothetical protein
MSPTTCQKCGSQAVITVAGVTHCRECAWRSDRAATASPAPVRPRPPGRRPRT